MPDSMEGAAMGIGVASGDDAARAYGQVYCLFCKTGQERAVVRELNARADAVALFPVKIKTEWRDGHWENLQKPLLPGYVFVYTANPMPLARAGLPGGVIRLLKDSDGRGDLRGADRAFADWMWARGGLIGLSKAVYDGERVEIVEGPLKDMGGVIVAVDRRKRIAKVELDIVGSTQRIWLSFDFFQGDKRS